jgi:hypothetical protein
MNRMLLFKRFHVFIALSFKVFRLATWSDELKGIIAGKKFES